jgi:hypothetical protein
MSTDQERARLYNKKILPLDQFKNKFLDALFTAFETLATDVYPKDGVFTSLVTPTAAGNNQVTIASAFRGVTGAGKTINIGSMDSRFANVKVPPDAGVSYHIAVEQAVVEKGIETNPRTGEFEYSAFIELPGRVATPDSVTDNGDGTITLTVNSLFESGKDNSGRSVRVWLKSRTDGGPGPLASTEAVAIETRTVTYSAPNNRITTVAKFGQTSVSTTASDYRVMSVGPTVKRSGQEDLRNTAGALFIADITSVASGSPIVTISTADQNVISMGLSDVDDAITDLRSGFNEVMRSGVISGLTDGGMAGLTMTVASGVYWMNGLRVSKAQDTVVLPDNIESYVYIDTDGDLKVTTSLSTAVTLPRLVLFAVTTSLGARTAITDVRRFWTRQNSKSHVTVGPTNCDFTSLAGAFKWAELVDGAGEDTWFTIVVQGDVSMSARIDFNAAVHLVGNSRFGSKVTCPAGTAAFRPLGPVSNVTIEGINFVLSTVSDGSKLLDLSQSDDESTEWVIRDCVISGGRNAHIIDGINPNTGAICRNWKIQNNLFQNPGHTTASWAFILLEQAQDCEISGNRFIGSSANENTLGIELMEGSIDNTIDDNVFDFGGRHIGIQDSNGAGTQNGSCLRNRIRKNRHYNGRSTSIRFGCANGPNYVEDCDFIGGMTASSGNNGMIEVNTVSTFGGGQLIIRGNSFRDWAGAAAIWSDVGNDHRIESNTLSTNVTAVIVGIGATAGDRLIIRGNHVDLDRGATTGNGKSLGIAMGLGASDSCLIEGNIILNCGDDAGVSTGVVKVDANNIISGNLFNNCRGVEILLNGANNSILGNSFQNVDTASAGTLVSLGASAEDALIMGNQMPTPGTGTIITANPTPNRTKLIGNITDNGQAIGNTPDSIIGVGLYRGTNDPASQSWAVGTTLISTVPFPSRTVGCHIPKRWALAAKVGNVESGIRFIFSDGTTLDRFNTTAGTIDETFDQFYLDGSHDLSIVRIQWVVRNVGGMAETQNPGQSKYEGFVIG